MVCANVTLLTKQSAFLLIIILALIALSGLALTSEHLHTMFVVSATIPRKGFDYILDYVNVSLQYTSNDTAHQNTTSYSKTVNGDITPVNVLNSTSPLTPTDVTERYQRTNVSVRENKTAVVDEPPETELEQFGNHKYTNKSEVKITGTDTFVLPDNTSNNKSNQTTNHLTAYINVREKGRIGNQMFQYAALFSITKRNSSWTPFLAPGMFPNLRQTFSASLSIPFMTLNRSDVAHVRENIDADIEVKRLTSLPLRNTTLYGFYQSWKFSHNVSKELRREFTFTPRVQKTALAFFTSVAPPDEASLVRVGIHVRRTTMITPHRIEMGEVPCPARYFEHAMEYFTAKYEHVQFIVTSDDMSWSKRNIKGDNVVYSAQSFAIDFAILALADHIITSLGTFSWWAGWLNSGQTIYYGVMPPPGTYMATMKDNNKWVPPKDDFNDWIPII